MKVLVCGSRDWTNREQIEEALSIYAPGTTLVHGDARGADQLAAKTGQTYGFENRAFPADWKKHGKRAGIIRNLQMLDEEPDLVIAFQCNGSRGTQHTIDEARRRGIPVDVVSG